MTEQATAGNSLNIEKTKSERTFEVAEKYIPIIAIVVFIILIGIYFLKFHGDFGDNADFGAFGDFIGGALNPILGFLTVLLLLTSIRFQIDELRLTRIDINKANSIHSDNQRTQAEILLAQQKETLISVAIPKLNRLMIQINATKGKNLNLSEHSLNSLAIKGLTNKTDLEALLGPVRHSAMYVEINKNLNLLVNDLKQLAYIVNILHEKKAELVIFIDEVRFINGTITEMIVLIGMCSNAADNLTVIKVISKSIDRILEECEP
jgi:hypothetical protein